MRIDLTQARSIALRGRPWTLRIEKGPEYLYATGRNITEPVEVGSGIRGAAPTLTLTTWALCEAQVEGLVLQGWDFADTPYVRMSPANLALVQGGPVVATPQAKSVSSILPPPRKGPSPAPATMPVAAPKTIAKAHLRFVRSEGTIKGMALIDASGSTLKIIPVQDGVDLAREQDLEILFGG